MSRPGLTVVFIVGCGRSGTTLLYELLAAHPETSWISTWTDRTAFARLAAFNPLFLKSRQARRFFPPRPSEGYRTWDRACPPHDVGHRAIEPAGVSRGTRDSMWRFVERHCAAAGVRVFINKNTRNSRRIALLHNVFPAARFINVSRDPRDTVSSLLRVHWWSDLPLWFRDGRTPKELCDTSADEAAVAAELVVRERRLIDRTRHVVPGQQWIDVEYEKLVSEPTAVVSTLLAFMGLSEAPSTLRRMQSIRRDSVGVHMRTLSVHQRAAADAVLAEAGTRSVP